MLSRCSGANYHQYKAIARRRVTARRRRRPGSMGALNPPQNSRPVDFRRSAESRRLREAALSNRVDGGYSSLFGSSSKGDVRDREFRLASQIILDNFNV